MYSNEQHVSDAVMGQVIWRQLPGVVLSRRVFATRGVLLVMKTLEDERYVVIKAYKCTVSEIWRDFVVLACIACTSYPYIQSLPTL